MAQAAARDTGTSGRPFRPPARLGAPPRPRSGPLYYVIVLIAITALYWRASPVGLVIASLMCGGDGLADIVGRRLGAGNPLPWNPEKSWAGSAAMFLGEDPRPRRRAGRQFLVPTAACRPQALLRRCDAACPPPICRPASGGPRCAALAASHERGPRLSAGAATGRTRVGRVAPPPGRSLLPPPSPHRLRPLPLAGGLGMSLGLVTFFCSLGFLECDMPATFAAGAPSLPAPSGTPTPRPPPIPHPACLPGPPPAAGSRGARPWSTLPCMPARPRSRPRATPTRLPRPLPSPRPCSGHHRAGGHGRGVAAGQQGGGRQPLCARGGRLPGHIISPGKRAWHVVSPGQVVPPGTRPWAAARARGHFLR